MKLEIKHLAPYLPYGLKIYSGELTNPTLIGIVEDYCLLSEYEYMTKNSHKTFTKPKTKQTLKFCKPLLRPLSDLTKEIEHNGEKFVPIVYLCEKYCNRKCVTKEMGENLLKATNGGAGLWFLYYDKDMMTFSLEDHFMNITNHSIAQYKMFEMLLKWHIDIFGLIDAGLATELR